MHFSYPSVDSQGRPVDVERAPADAPFEKIHVMGVDRDEIYFEVRRRPGRTAGEAYAILCEHLPDQYPDVGFSPMEPTELAGRPAHEFSFRWADQVRHAVLVEAAGSMYRVIYRPHSPANLDILASVTIDD